MIKKIKDFLRWNSGVVIFITCVIVVIGLLSWVCRASCVRIAKIINESYGTNYSASDIFLAGNTIETLAVGTKQNINLNMKEE